MYRAAERPIFHAFDCIGMSINASITRCSINIVVCAKRLLAAVAKYCADV